MSAVSFAPAYLIPLLLNLVGIYAFTRLLNPAEYGTYAFLIGVVTLCQGALFSWIGLGAKRYFEWANGQGKLAELTATTYLGLLCSTLILAGGIMLWSLLLGGAPVSNRLLWIAGAVIVAKEFSTLSKVLELAALSRARYLLMECGESVIGMAVGLLLCWRQQLGASGIMLGLLAGSCAVLLFDSRRIVARIWHGRVDLRLQMEILRFALPISVAFFVEYLVSSVDRFLIEFFLGAHALGIYAVGYGIADRAVGAVFLALSVGAYPLVVRALERDGTAAAQDQARSNVTLLIAAAMPAFGGFLLTSGRIASVLVGQSYVTGAAELMPVCAIAVFLYGLRTQYYAHAPHLANRTSALIVASVPAAVINLGLNMVLLPSIGLAGAAWARLLAYAAALAISIFQAQRLFPLPFPPREFAKSCLATGIMCGALALLQFKSGAVGLISMIATGVVIYAALCLCLNIARLRTMLWSRGPIVVSLGVERLRSVVR